MQITFLSVLVGAVLGLQRLDNATRTEVEDFLRRHPEINNEGNLIEDEEVYMRCDRTRPLELYILQDGTRTFEGFLEGFRFELPKLMDDLSSEYDEFYGGITTFADKPTEKMPDIPCYKQIVRLTDDVERLKTACTEVSFLSGTSDGWPENSIETLAFAAGSHAGFSKPSQRPDAIRIAVIITDTLGRLMRNPPGPANPNLSNELICEIGADFPPLTQVSEILRAAKVIPLPVITELHTPGLVDWWRMILFDDQKGRMNLNSTTGGLVMPFDMNAESLLKAIRIGIQTLTCRTDGLLPTATLQPSHSTVESLAFWETSTSETEFTSADHYYTDVAADDAKPSRLMSFSLVSI